jgi:periplasmic divalent cation tolerance protein
MAATRRVFRIVLTTVDSDEAGERLARTLVERRLAACVNVVGPLRSYYRWRGEVVAEHERLVVIKTTAERFPALRDAVQALHDYDVPEVVALDVADGSAPYLEWLAGCLDEPSVD